MSSRRFSSELAGRLDSPDRLNSLPPSDVLAAMAVQPGEVIADVGAGTGYFSFPLATAAGPDGSVYAIDAQEEMLALLNEKVAERKAENIRLVHAEGSETGLPAESCNRVFLANVWHEFDDRDAMAREAHRILRRAGRVAIVDWRPDVERTAGPPLDHRIAPEVAMAELSAAGFDEITHQQVGKHSWLVQGTAR